MRVSCCMPPLTIEPPLLGGAHGVPRVAVAEQESPSQLRLPYGTDCVREPSRDASCLACSLHAGIERGMPLQGACGSGVLLINLLILFMCVMAPAIIDLFKAVRRCLAHGPQLSHFYRLHRPLPAVLLRRPPGRRC